MTSRAKMSQRRRRRWLWGLFLALLAAFPFAWRVAVVRAAQPRLGSLTTAPERPVAIVFGARVYGGERLSLMLRDRVETAVQLYQAGKVDRLLMSGGVYEGGLSEPEAMRRYALGRGVPDAAILVDEAGLRTYDTCYRARHIFGLSAALLVTQEFHLPRALFTCRALGISADGVIADRRLYHPRTLEFSERREFLATLVALLDVVMRQTPAGT